ncbi:hypothetical protein F5J12DRAFT_896920 [Pisolithus orientalis]|uniref:uncharacterized protein n=1 Tax=Pisolithus orientalis TaxID=936130 RepID=UPI002223F09B|nr:uncharacterized protein F5J12DRAFT_899170 [Pisolithus orientalis]XP_051595973.1 uncharacterized protein F5J12DRAFT_896920 [Pisolithus orientalis]KAI5984922.1 hypothetical protein F5J12DRAFT_899170 [Pisolithus orientalis]KAI5993804.1 hypothetical protein F5J12DRAFT_896920 [Pisolithus orientalis]
MTGLMKMEEWKRDDVMQRGGYHKIIKSCEQAKKDGYGWSWIDTSVTVASTSRAYQNAQICYAYLRDADELPRPTEPYDPYGDLLCKPDSRLRPEWFMRGWTLQELIAPKQLKFFNKDWVPIGNKRQLAPVGRHQRSSM